jgi:acyl-CoA thioester hydrolase
VSYSHPVRVRYVDCDMQGVVYNAHYLTFVDDGFDCWLRELSPDFEHEHGWEVMLKRVEIVWDGPAHFGETIEIAVEVSRWGNTSFDATFTGTVAARAVFVATITYVTVDHDEHNPLPVPGILRSHLGG